MPVSTTSRVAGGEVVDTGIRRHDGDGMVRALAGAVTLARRLSVFRAAPVDTDARVKPEHDDGRDRSCAPRTNLVRMESRTRSDWYVLGNPRPSPPPNLGPSRGPSPQGEGAKKLCATAASAFALLLTALPASAAPPRLLILGDSLSAGYGLPHADGFESQLQAALRAHGHEVTIIDGAVSGDTSAGGRARLDWTLGDQGADAAIVELGANDGLRGVDPRDTAANLTAILDQLAAKHIPVLLSGMYAPPNLGPDYERDYRAVFDRLGQRHDLIYDPFFLAGVATVPDLNQADRIHPNAEGVRRIVARLLPLVETLLGKAHPE